MKIDYIFPYVNPNDPIWLEKFRKYSGDSPNTSERFRDFDLLRYVFRGLEYNMPWLNSIVLLVDNRNQTPDWLEEDKVRIVTHEEFIPKEYLPIFNSASIEMFLGNITNLSDYIIYGNDDFYPIKPSSPSDYFTSEGLPKISFKIKNSVPTTFLKQVKNNYLTAKELFPHHAGFGIGYFIKQRHWSQPIRLDTIKMVSVKLHKEMMNSVTRFRKNSVNLSQYLYYDAAILSGEYRSSTIVGSYFEGINSKRIKSLEYYTKTLNPNWLCINDTKNADVSLIPLIEKALLEILPYKSSFEA